MLAVTLSREINILTYLGLKLPFLSLRAAWNEQFAFFQVKSSSLLPCFNMKSCPDLNANLIWSADPNTKY